MTLLTVLFVLCGVALVGFLMWLFNRHVMLAAPYKAISAINLIVLVVTIVVLLHVVWHALSKIKL
jgi:hypothetical protein